ncbi:hypothetical protein CRYO30217_03469 [Parvicella tangerina]|uniref:RHS repeat-associated core domain-containing protein n=2 Tax=Parvicella tangerina TaxID=2829795 RepID=A0A916JQK3_9FLAO|nr:hypothetical protein CRYO30217_03469 [Parvicella tangerina]
MEKDDEVKGGGNSYDFGARMYDSRLGRWLSIDELAGKYPNESPFNFVSNIPIIHVDPDGREKIVVIGGADNGGQADKAKFVNAGLKQYRDYLKEVGSSGETVTVIITDDYLTEDMIEYVKSELKIIELQEEMNLLNSGADSYAIETSVYTTWADEQILHYINTKSFPNFEEILMDDIKTGKTSVSRELDVITDMAFFGHGLTGVGFAPGYPDNMGGNEGSNISSKDVQGLNKDAFDRDAVVGLYICNGATGSNNLAKAFSGATGTTVFGWEGQTTFAHQYATGNVSDYAGTGTFDKGLMKIAEFFGDIEWQFMEQIREADYSPKGGDDSKPDKVTYKNGEEVKRESTP